MSGRAEIQAGRAFVSLYVKTSEFANGLVNAENRLRRFAESMGAMGRLALEFTPGKIIQELTNVLTRTGARISAQLDRIGSSFQSLGTKAIVGAAGMGSAILAAATHFASTGDAMEEMSQRTGVSTQALSELGYAARQTGADAASLETGFRRMQRLLGEAAGGGKPAIEDLGKLGLTIEQLNGLSPDRQMEMIADGLAGIQDPSLKAAAAMAVFGREGTSLLPMMVGGAAGLRQFRDEAKLLGLSITPKQAHLANDLADAFDNLKEATFAGVFAAGEALAPMLIDALKVATDLAVEFTSWVRNNKELVMSLGRAAAWLLGIGVTVSAIGIGFAGAAKVVAVITGSIGLLGSAVSALLPLITIIGILGTILTYATGPALAVAGAISSAVAASGVFAGVLGLLGTVASAVLPIVLTVAGGLVVAFGALVAVATAATAAAAFGAYAFWKLTDPIKSLLPLVRGVIDSFSEIGAAIMRGDWGAAADAVIEGMRTALLRGAEAILTMMRTAFQRLPEFINGTLSGTSGIVGSIVGKIEQAFARLWPALKLSFSAFTSFAGDVLQQLPAIAGYVTGRIVRAMMDGFMQLTIWLAKTAVNLTVALFQTFSGFGPRLLKAMLTGDIAGLGKEFGAALATAMVGGGLFAGLAKADMPSFSPSAETIAAWNELSGAIGGVQSKVASAGGGSAAGEGGGATTKPIVPADETKSKTPNLSIDMGRIEKYRAKLHELSEAFNSGVIDEREFSAGLVELRRDTLGIDPTPLDQYKERLNLLSIALRDGTITTAEWMRQANEAQQSILGIDPSPLAQFAERVQLLRSALDGGAITQQQYADQLRDTGREIFSLDPAPLDALRERVRVLNQALQSGAINQAQWREEFAKSRRDILGLDVNPLTQFAERATALKQQLAAGAISFAEYSAEFRKSQQSFLGFDSDPITTYKNKLLELRQALAGGLITKEAFHEAAVAAIPDKIKSVVEETRTPLEKYKKELSELNKLKGVIDPTTFARKEQQLKKQYFSDLSSQGGPQNTPLVTYSAAGAAAAGRGGGSPQDRLLTEAQKAAKIRAQQLEEARLGRRAAEKLAAGMTMK